MSGHLSASEVRQARTQHASLIWRSGVQRATNGLPITWYGPVQVPMVAE
jgi:hypothetical protein